MFGIGRSSFGLGTDAETVTLLEHWATRHKWHVAKVTGVGSSVGLGSILFGTCYILGPVMSARKGFKTIGERRN